MPETYKHGTYGVLDETIIATPRQSGTVPVYIGLAPVHLIQGWKEKNVVNNPVKLNSMEAAQKQMGYLETWDPCTLCEAFFVHFENEVETAGPIIAINVLNPDVHKKGTATTTTLTLVGNLAYIESTTIIMDTLAIADCALGVDYTAEYDFNRKRVVITKLTEKLTSSSSVTYNEIDTASIDESTIIGKKTDEGVYEGMGCIDLIYPELGLIPGVICAPGYSEEPDVYEAMLDAAYEINNHWNAMVNADIPLTETSLDDVILWKKTNGYTSEFSKVFWPQWKLSTGEVCHLSVIAAWRMSVTDLENNNIPMESPSNKEIPGGKQYFGEGSTNRGYDQNTMNKLNAEGITTAVLWGGRAVLWGPHTAAYSYEDTTDPRVVYDSGMRMMLYVLNSFQEEHADEIDKPMTKALADTIKAREQEKLDALVAVGALIGEPVVEFSPLEEAGDYVEGNFEWKMTQTPTPPNKSSTLRAAYSTAGFSVYLEDENEEEGEEE